MKFLKINWQQSFGRNNQGKITSRHRGGGDKFLYKLIDFKYSNYGNNATQALILKKIYDPVRKLYLGLIHVLEGRLIGFKKIIILSKHKKKGDIIYFGQNTPLTEGNSMPLYKVPVGSSIHNIETIPGKGSSLVRNAVNKAFLIALNDKYATVKLPSGEIRFILKNCFCTVGELDKINLNSKKYYKAGINIKNNKRPRVRGVAMNACDHPHGGGEGKNTIGKKIEHTPWGKPSKGIKTRCKNKYSFNNIIKK